MLPGDEQGRHTFLSVGPDAWQLRAEGLERALTLMEFGKVLLHLGKHRGARVKKTVPVPTGDEEAMELVDGSTDQAGADLEPGSFNDEAEEGEQIGQPGEPARNDAKEKREILAASNRVARDMKAAGVPTYGALVHAIRSGQFVPEHAPKDMKASPEGRHIRVRNTKGVYVYCPTREDIRHEFRKLWEQQAKGGGELASELTDEYRVLLDDEDRSTDRGRPFAGNNARAQFRQRWIDSGLLFAQRWTTWDVGTLGRCDLHPSERCVPRADMYASRYLVVETVNRLRLVEEDGSSTPLKGDQRQAVLLLLCGPFKVHKSGQHKGKVCREFSNADIRGVLQLPKFRKEQWPKLSSEVEDEKKFPGDWFHREIVLGAFGECRWEELGERRREKVNRAILRFDPDEPSSSPKFKAHLAKACGCTPEEIAKLTAAWEKRSSVQSRLRRSRRAIRNLLKVMDVDPPDGKSAPSEIEARRSIARSLDFTDATDGRNLDDRTKERYLKSSRGLNAAARQYQKKHNGRLPPPQMMMNPVVRKSLHEVKSHLEAIRARFGKPDAIVIELFRDAKMGKKELDRHNAQQARRATVRLGILRAYGPAHAELAAYEDNILRVLLALQQRCLCPLCGQTMTPGDNDCRDGITLRTAFEGTGCQLSHIFPIARGGPKGPRNMVLAHTQCNQSMDARYPREWWGEDHYKTIAKTWLSRIYNAEPVTSTDRDKTDKTFGAWWPTYFTKRDNRQKLAMFGKTPDDFKGFTEQQRNDTRAATRGVMRFIADGLYAGKGLPEDAPGLAQTGQTERRLIFARDGWIGNRLKEEWGLVFNVHGGQAHAVERSPAQRKAAEKDRKDHRHHAVDAIVLALASDSVIAQWHTRERDAQSQPGGAAAAKNFRRNNPIFPPGPWGGKGASFKQAVDALRAEVQRAVYGEGTGDRPVVHRPEGTRIRGGFHEDSLMSPAAGRESPRYMGDPDEVFVDSIRVADLKPEHLRLPTPSTPDSVRERLTAMYERSGLTTKAAKAEAKRQLAAMNGDFGQWAEMDPAPGKGGLVVSVRERTRLRKMIESFNFVRTKKGGSRESETYKVKIRNKKTKDTGEEFDSDTAEQEESDVDSSDSSLPSFTNRHAAEMAAAGGFKDSKGRPILKVKRLRICKRPVFVGRQREPGMSQDELRQLRAFVGGAIHHAAYYVDNKGKTSAVGVTLDCAVKRNAERIAALKEAGVPSADHLRRMARHERRAFREKLRSINAAHPIVDGRDDPKRGRFLMSLAIGETVWMRPSKDEAPGYFVVLKIDVVKSGSATAVLAAHWDARPSGERRSLMGKGVKFSGRDKVEMPPTDLRRFAPPGHDWPVKVRPRLYAHSGLEPVKRS